MSNNKQSSVEWLYNKMYEHRGNITIEEFEQAKAMHKEEIMEAHYAPKYGCFSEQYYNETFKKQPITMLTPLQKLYNEVKDLPCTDETFKTKVIDRIFEIHGEEKYVIANAFNDGVCEHREDPERFLSGYEYFANTYNL